MLNIVETFIRAQDMIPTGSTVLCAVSGGADSIAMLHVLYRLRPKLNFNLAAAHYNHRLRGLESDRDAVFTAQFVQLCCGPQRLSQGEVLPAVQLYSGSGDVAAQAKLRRTGIEETARDMRYAFLRQAAREAGADLIATAHTANDNVETILFHLARGSGLRGLGGIPPKRDGVIRPLLTISRQQVEEYLFRLCLPYMEDSSNQNDDYTRNRIRHQVLPVLEDVAPGFAGRLVDTAARLREDENCLTELARALADQAVPWREGLAVNVQAIAAAPDPIAVRALRLLLGQLWGGDQNCSAVHLNSLLRLCRGTDPSAELSLPHRTNARRCYEKLLLVPRLGYIPLKECLAPLAGELDCGPWRIACQEERYNGQLHSPWEFWLSRQDAPELAIRPRRSGDRLTPPGRLGKTVKKWMIEEKVPRFQREVLPVFTCGGQVAAVAGLGPDRRFAAQNGQPAWHMTIVPVE
ncbi:tRNA lysidine(34) synthetase TilS [Pseudoflavonifractor sp. 60]|uniref:tRNA lysidine(34) synthetase TilS n=1 Tax=Pseudoflavonifractor sp. 60 TaxID=2304576 RepID=UPI00136A1FEF|nr:tRNA lysidine(34) synthetase TilS [Pseudoflavonifractor sp. 60]